MFENETKVEELEKNYKNYAKSHVVEEKIPSTLQLLVKGHEIFDGRDIIFVKVGIVPTFHTYRNEQKLFL